MTSRAVRSGWIFTCAVILFGAFALRLWNLGTQSLWHDEAWSVFSAYRPLAYVDPNAPIIFYGSLGFWLNLVGDSVWAMRFWSLLLGVITVAVAAPIARRWFGTQVAALTAIFVTLSPILWVFSQEIRAYVAMPLLALILLLLVDALLRPRQGVPIPRRVWIWLLLVEIITLYTHNLSVPIIAWMNVTVIIAWIFRREWRRIGIWLVTQVGAFVLYLPWLLTQRPTGTALNTPPAIGPALLWNIWQSYFTGIKAMVGADNTLMALTAIFGLVAFIGIAVALIRCRTQRTVLLLSQAMLIPVFEMGIILAAHIDFHPRYFIVGVPATLMLIAVGLGRLSLYPPTPLSLAREYTVASGGKGGASSLQVPRPEGEGFRVRATYLSFAIPAILAAAIMIQMANVTYSSPIYQHDDFRSIAERYNHDGLPDVLIVPYGWEPTLDYYSHHMPFNAQIVGIPLHASAYDVFARLISDFSKWQPTKQDTIGRIDLLTWYQLPADVRGAYSCLLGTLMVPTNSQTVAGLKIDSYQFYSRLKQPSPIAADYDSADMEPGAQDVDFGQVKLLDTWTVSVGSGTTCFMSRWQLTQPTAQNFRISVRVQNQFGWQLAQTDGDLLNDSGVPTAYWKSGEIGTAFSLIKVPDGLNKPDFATVMVSVYDQKTQQPLPAIINNEPAGTEVELGTATRLDNYGAFEFARTDADLELIPGNLYLHRKDISASPVYSGQEVRAALEWWMLGKRYTDYDATITLQGENWQLSDSVKPGTAYDENSKDLSFHRFVIPAEAKGKATLRLEVKGGKSLVLGEYDIIPGDHSFVEPPIPTRVDAHFVDAGSLVGVDIPATVSRSESPAVKLIWQANNTPTTAYTVFVHLLDASGQVIAQDDAQPARFTRPTTAWIKGEYIVDEHSLRFIRQDYAGPATVEVGLYDQSTGKRVLLEQGNDHVIIPVTVEVH